MLPYVCVHGCAQVTSMAMDEYVALPPRAALSVRLEGAARAQAFLMLHKL